MKVLERRETLEEIKIHIGRRIHVGR